MPGVILQSQVAWQGGELGNVCSHIRPEHYHLIYNTGKALERHSLPLPPTSTPIFGKEKTICLHNTRAS